MAHSKQTVLRIDINHLSVFVLLNYHELRVFYYFLRPPPLKILKHYPPSRQNSSVLVELGVVSWKLFVHPFLSWVASDPLQDGVLFLVILLHGVVIFLLFLCGLAFSHFLGGVLYL